MLLVTLFGRFGSRFLFFQCGLGSRSSHDFFHILINDDRLDDGSRPQGLSGAEGPLAFCPGTLASQGLAALAEALVSFPRFIFCSYILIVLKQGGSNTLLGIWPFLSTGAAAGLWLE